MRIFMISKMRVGGAVQELARYARLLGLIVVLATTPGCATRGVLDLTCLDLAPVILEPGPVSASITQDQGRDFPSPARGALGAVHSAETPVGSEPDFVLRARQLLAARSRTASEARLPCEELDPIFGALLAQYFLCDAPGNAPFAAARKSGAPPGVLLLSGGGQWGAFGASFLKSLAERGEAPDVGVITGISTGAMQALLLGDSSADRFRRLEEEYTIEDERKIVDRGPRVLAVLTGSVAGLKPLVAKIEQALCSEDVVTAVMDGREADCLLTRLARPDAPRVSVAYVDAKTGALMAVNINRLARTSEKEATTPTTRQQRIRDARRCITTAAIASAAMPVFYQQVRVTYNDPDKGHVTTRTVLDGGVRQSVFLPAISSRVFWAEALARELQGRVLPQRLYVLRNGPTIANEDKHADGRRNVLATALRSYEIVVNQLEIGSIVALRAERPTGPINLATADGRPTDDCIVDRENSRARRERMFDPDFMTCLRDVGVRKARSDRPWLSLAHPPGLVESSSKARTSAIVQKSNGATR